LLENEITWLPKIKTALPIDIPAPIHIGEPDNIYPWTWSIIPWYDGVNGSVTQANDDEIIRLADFLKVLHQNQPKDAPYNDHRCLALSYKSVEVEERIKRLKDSNLIKDDRILEFWNRAVQESVPSNQSLIHGDMHPRNIVIDNGVLNAVIDWGDITAGDVATDLSSIWMLFEDPKVRGIGFKHYGADESTIRRAQGWAIFSGTLFLDLGLSSNGEYRRSGNQILKNVLS